MLYAQERERVLVRLGEREYFPYEKEVLVRLGGKVNMLHERESYSKTVVLRACFWEREREGSPCDDLGRAWVLGFGTGWFELKIVEYLYSEVSKSGVPSNTYCVMAPSSLK